MNTQSLRIIGDSPVIITQVIERTAEVVQAGRVIRMLFSQYFPADLHRLDKVVGTFAEIARIPIAKPQIVECHRIIRMIFSQYLPTDFQRPGHIGQGIVVQSEIPIAGTEVVEAGRIIRVMFSQDFLSDFHSLGIKSDSLVVVPQEIVTDSDVVQAVCITGMLRSRKQLQYRGNFQKPFQCGFRVAALIVFERCPAQRIRLCPECERIDRLCGERQCQQQGKPEEAGAGGTE